MSIQTKIIRGKQARPLRILIHGDGGIGKSTFFSKMPAPLFVDPERRTGHLNVERVQPNTWEELLEDLTGIYVEKSCKTLVFSTIDFMEQMLWKFLCDREGSTHIDSIGGGWGKGANMAKEEFGKFLGAMERFVDAGINIAIESHSEVETFNNPNGESYDRWNVKLQRKSRALFVAKMDAIGFAAWEDFAKKKNKDDKSAKAFTSGRRLLWFGHNPACQTKAGLTLPDQMPLEWDAFAKAAGLGAV